MAALTVWKFNSPTGAAQTLAKLESLRKQQVIEIQDAAIVEWPQGKKTPKTRQAVNLTATGALGGAFWGMLIGLLFLAPWLGLAIGAGMGALSGKLAGTGIDKKFIDEVSANVKPGGSALFAYTREGVVDKILPQLGQFHGKLISASVTNEQEAQLREAFGAEEAQPAQTK